MSLVADYGESSAESEKEEENVNDKPKDSPYKQDASSSNAKIPLFESTSDKRLPAPDIDAKIKNSVFVNPFLEAEKAKLSVLNRHVKMVPQGGDKREKVKGLCRNYQKGYCTHGNRCWFAHTDSVKTTTKTPAPPAGGSGDSVQNEGTCDCPYHYELHLPQCKLNLMPRRVKRKMPASRPPPPAKQAQAKRKRSEGPCTCSTADIGHLMSCPSYRMFRVFNCTDEEPVEEKKNKKITDVCTQGLIPDKKVMLEHRRLYPRK